MTLCETGVNPVEAFSMISNLRMDFRFKLYMHVSRLQTLDQHHLDTMARLAWPCSQVGATLSLTNREAALSHADDTA